MDNNEIRENLCEMYGDDDLLFMDNMSLTEAVEFFDFNQLGAYVGKRTPGFLDIIVDNQ